MKKPGINPAHLDSVLDVAAAAYDFIAEMEHPAPDPTMRALTRQRLSESIQALRYEERVVLARRAGR